VAQALVRWVGAAVAAIIAGDFATTLKEL